ncbi:hypothetical protein C1S80_04335 [Mycolicibacterium aubagnense]|nr:hypothetical protein C1S80_04335 [Mycolicibacterium aubagnense]
MGIALAGAGAIALAPIAQPMPAIAELQARAVSSAKVALTAAVNPIDQWGQIIRDALANGGALVHTYMQNPAPILHQLIINALGYGGQTFAALQASFGNLVDQLRLDNPYGFPVGVQQGISQILAGQIYNGYNTLFGAGLGLIIGPVFPLLGLLQIPVTMVQNVANVVAQVPNILLGVGLGAIGTMNGVMQATAFQVQAVVDALKTGDLVGAVGAVVATPGAVVNSLLNGFALSGAPGILSPGGIIDTVIQALNSIAHAIAPTTPAPVAAKVADAGPAVLPSAALSAATVTLGAEKVTAPDTAKVAATKTAPAEPAAAAPAATGPAAGAPAAASPETPSTATEPKPESGTTSGGTTTPNGGSSAPTGGTGTAGEPTKPSGSTDSGTGSGSTTTPKGGTDTAGGTGTTGTTAGTKTGTTGEPTKPTKPSGSTGSETGSGSTTTPNGGTSTTGGTKTGTPGKTGEPTKPTKPAKPSGSTGSGTGSGSSGSGSGSGSGASASGGGASHAAA